MVAVESSPGHDIGIVSLTGALVYKQLKKLKRKDKDFKKIYRVARTTDIEKWEQVVALENKTMLRSRQITAQLKLNMKIGDVEYQGDGNKAIFYYIAEERVDFRELIKVLADEFKIRVEMKQIGARQEAGRIGSIGSCGRELCCSTWITNFVSVTTTAAKDQELSLNPQKLAGQCGKLKCCLNYEHDSYLDAQKSFPSTSIVLETREGRAFHLKTDVYKKIMWYSFNEHAAVNLTAVHVDRVNEIIKNNKQGVIVEELVEKEKFSPDNGIGFADILDKDSISKFEKKRKSRKKRRRPSNNNRSQFRNNKNKKPNNKTNDK
jgi:cell fate regulator YaaT (PSP1 superfamily)